MRRTALLFILFFISVSLQAQSNQVLVRKDGTGYRLAVPGSDLDTVEFERLVARGRELPGPCARVGAARGRRGSCAT